MNERQLEVLKANTASEKKTINELLRIYKKARKDCEAKIKELAGREDLQNLQTIVYQKQYQEALKKQLDSIIDMMQGQQFETISSYLTESYENGYVGAMYDLMGQGIPLILPINQDQVVQAIQLDSKLSKGMYDRLGEDIKKLKKSVRQEVSRGVANGSTWFQIAQQISKGMNSPFNVAQYNSMRIARTEGHRIQQESQYQAIVAAKNNGCDVVREWVSTLDAKTRTTHQMLDGQFREVDEPFEIDGKKAMFPGDFGRPEEDIHCRCCVTQRAKWALDEDELKKLHDRADYFGLDKNDNFNDFRSKYLNLPPEAATVDVNTTLKDPLKSSTDKAYDGLLKNLAGATVKYNPVKDHPFKITDEEIVNALAGGDQTEGSCASLGLAYIGQKQGWDILDYRGGESLDFFSTTWNLYQLSAAKGMKTLHADGASSTTVGNRLLKQVQEGKEYYLCVGRHASIVRKKDGVLQYLELQSARDSGWTDFDKSPRRTLEWRFGCNSRQSGYFDFMLDIAESDFNTDEFRSLMGYINTQKDQQKKGEHGTIK